MRTVVQLREFETLITSYVTDLEIYNKNPLTLNKLLEYLEENRGVNSVKMRQNIQFVEECNDCIVTKGM